MTILTKPLFSMLLVALFALAAILGGPGSAVEVRLMQLMAEARAQQPELTQIVGRVTELGGGYVTLSVTAAASLWLLLRGAPARALVLAMIVLIERSLVEGLKDWIGRPRPAFELDWQLQSLAYPSGHAAGSLTAYLATALILAPPARRGPWAAGALLLAFIVGLSRIHLGVHWPSDVLGGWAFGLLAVSTAMWVGRKSELLRFEPQHEIVGRHRPALNEDQAA